MRLSRALEQRDRFGVADHGHVQRGRQDLELATEADVETLHGHPGLGGDRCHRGREVSVAQEQAGGGSEAPLLGDQAGLASASRDDLTWRFLA